ncbi:hypothetical protein HPB52_012680 [Rhipicephalus sanguineus]|uniref:PPPDE domain-containing protein n=1 Tax=Rhipicephalus sanguineus TaxID=34632 RepID=A0A9D4PDP4_RHISA|nr:hypothetical protein HPB52_012680 [Rhipicephalus sanguineus]
MEDASRGHAESDSEVLLYVYDLSNGLAKTLSPALLGKELPGMWHTSIVLRGTEYFFGSAGVDSCPAGRTDLGKPDRVVSLGRTELPNDVCVEYIRDLGRYNYKSSSYHLFRRNCNNFSQDLSLFLTGNSIPREIRELPDDFLSTPMGSMMVHSFEHLSIAVRKALEQHSTHEPRRSPKSPRPP